MNTTKSFLFILISTILAAGLSAAAYVKFDDVKGESRDKAHEGWIDITSVSGLNASSSSKSNKGHAPHQDLVLVKELDKSSPKLAEACTNGAQMGDVTISRGSKYYVLKDATVVSYERKGNKEEITLRCKEINVKPIRLEPKAATANHNTQSDKAQPIATSETESEGESKAQDYNSSRSNKES